MAEMSINEAIEYVREWYPVDEALRTLIRVAEAWLKLEKWLQQESRGQRDWPSLALLTLRKMDEYLNPTPKTDLQRVREFVDAKEYLSEELLAAHGKPVYVRIDSLLDFIDQLEKEKANG